MGTADQVSKMGMGMLDQDEKIKLVMLFMHGQNDQATTEELETIVRWAEETRMQNAFLENVLDATMIPVLTEDGEIVFKLTPKGEQQVEATLLEAAKVGNSV